MKIDYEFYTFEGKLWYMCRDGRTGILSEKDTDIVSYLIDLISERFPEAFNALREHYVKSSENAPYYRYLIARRFCMCNFGNLDATEQDLSERKMRFERVQCPLRGECLLEGVVCCPKMNTSLTESEFRVMRLFYEGKDKEEIAAILYISPLTVKRHQMSAYDKLGVHSLSDFIRYANDNNMFN